jgi:citrate/tricarballylate utilization protein
MQTLEALAREATDLAAGRPAGALPLQDAEVAEVARVMQICNACRYCEGFCAVFPAMTRRLQFDHDDAHFLANLCHQCGACLHACQYAPPHEFAVNVPRAMAQVRARTYADHAWPAPLGRLYQRNGLTIALALTAGLALFLMLAAARTGSLWGPAPAGSFYAIFPHGTMVSLFAPVFLFAVLALALGVRRFWRASQPGPASAPAVTEAAHDALTLRYLDGGHGQGCNNDDDAFTLARRRFHHFTFYGFMLCFAATSVGTLYHYLLGWSAPYAATSLPKLLGIAGGISLVVGTAGLWRLNLRRHALQVDPAQRPMDRAFIALLFLVASSGLGLMALKATPALAVMLCIHLGAVMAFFATMPYGKFAHGIYRSAALLKWAIEKRQPSRLQLADD